MGRVRPQHLPEPFGCRFEPTEPAEAGRQADAAADVRADAQDGASPRDQSSLPSRGAPGALLVVERVQGLAEDGIAAVIAGEKNGAVRNSLMP